MKHLVTAFLLLLCLSSCMDTTEKSGGVSHSNSIYHWKTCYNPTAWESDFMKRHHIERIYLRFFDVDIDHWNVSSTPSIIPVGTTHFEKTPSDEFAVIPTVFITVDALRAMTLQTMSYADKITTRIIAMARCHHMMEQIHEVQIDCDWTVSTQALYFELLKHIKSKLQKQGIKLSATIRLHQLFQSAPPVDHGTLMVYNTGAIQSNTTQNSILCYDDVASYLRQASNYELPLDFAYPTFAWGIWFREGKFKSILRHTDYSDRSLYEHLDGNKYRVLKSHYVENHQLLEGDLIRYESSDFTQVLRVKQSVELEYATPQSSVVLYHLDSANLSKFTDYEINLLYRR